MQKYRPTAEARNSPRRYYLEHEKVWIGIGGSITVENLPPKLPASYIVHEATEAQYELLYNKGLTKLVELTQTNESQHSKSVRTQQSDPGIDQ